MPDIETQTDEIIANITGHKPKDSKKPKPKPKPKGSKEAKKPSKNAPSGKGKYLRKCAYAPCGKPFRTDDPRKIYHDRKCGSKRRSTRWFQRAAQALRKLRKGEKS